MSEERRDGGDGRKLINVSLDERSVVRRSADIEHERAVAIFDLLEQNYFHLLGDESGPYALHLSVEEGRLLFDIRNEADEPLDKVALSLAPFRRIVKDYFTVCESYFEAIKTASPSRIQAIDMGRRGLHIEGSDLLRERLEGRIEIDLDTARRLFTLICVLHIRG